MLLLLLTVFPFSSQTVLNKCTERCYAESERSGLVKKFHYAWVICIAGTLMLIVSTGLMVNAFSVYIPYIIDDYGFTNTQTSLLSTVRNLVALGATFFVDRYYRRMNVRAGIVISLIAGAVAFLCFALARSFAMFCVAAAFSGFNYSIGGLVPMSVIVNRWFEDRRAFAVGVCSAGSGLSTIIVPPLLTMLIENTSVRTAFYVEMATIFSFAVIEFLIVKNDPAECGMHPYQTGRRTIDKIKNTAPDLFEPLSAKYVIMLLAALFFLGATGNSGFIHLAVLYTTEGFSSMSVAFAISVIGVSLIFGKILFGVSADKLGAYKTNKIFFALLISGMGITCLAGIHQIWTLYAGMIILGFGLSVTTVGMSCWAAEFADSRGLASMLKRLQVAYLIGGLVFSTVPGAICDACGSYVPAYILYTVFALLTTVFIQTVFRHRKQRD